MIGYAVDIGGDSGERKEFTFTVTGEADRVDEFIVQAFKLANDLRERVNEPAIPITTASPCGCGDCDE